MSSDNYQYFIFDFSLKSNVALPELPQSPESFTQLSFHLSNTPLSSLEEPRWLHHWRLPNGQTSSTFSKSATDFVIRFSNVAEFHFFPNESHIVCFAAKNIPHETVRHLLLDQFVPRIVAYLGRSVVHASGIIVNNFGILFLGDTGSGKSTLCASFHRNGFRIFCDDSIVLEKNQDKFIGIPSYPGIRLLPDSLNALQFQHQCLLLQSVSHYSPKKRLSFPNGHIEQHHRIPIKVFFLLNCPETSSDATDVSFTRLAGIKSIFELMRHCFFLDPTDNVIIGRQLQLIAELLASKKVHIYRLKYQRNHCSLPLVCNKIVDFVETLA